MNSKMCQVAACLVPKFKLNWTTQDNRDEIKHTFIDAMTEFSVLSNSQGKNQPSLVNSQKSDSEDDFFSFDETIGNNSIDDIHLLVDNYLSNINITSPTELPLPLKEAFIQYNTSVPSSAHVERLFSAGGQLFDKRRGSMADHNFEMLKFNKYFD